MARYFDLDLFWLHYDNEDEGTTDTDTDDADDGAGDSKGGKPAGRFFTQEELDKIVTKRSQKAVNAQKQALSQLERIQETVRLTDEQKEQLETEIEKLKKQTLTAEEIAKREAKKAKDAYEQQLVDAQKSAQTWEGRYKSMYIDHGINSAAQKHGVLSQAMPMVTAFLSPKIKLDEQKNDSGEFLNHNALVDFTDQGADGKPVQVQLTVEETLKRMKELPELYGHLFQAPNGGGLGGTSGRPGAAGSKGFRSGMSQEDYMKLRKENPSEIYK